MDGISGLRNRPGKKNLNKADTKATTKITADDEATRAQLFQIAAENIPGMIYRLVMSDAGEMHFDFISRQGLSLFEVNKEFSPKDFVDMVHPEDRVHLQLKWTESINEMCAFEWRGRICLEGNREKHIFARSIPTVSKTSGIIWDGIMIDITEQSEQDIALRTAYQVIQEKEDTLKNLINSVPGVIYQWRENKDKTSELFYVSPKLKEYFDLTPEQLLNPVELIHPEDRISWRSSIDEANRTGAPWRFEGRMLYSDGRLKWWQGYSTSVPLGEGDFLYTGIVIDITEQKLAQLKEKETSQRFTAVINVLPDLIFLVDRNAKVLDIFSGVRQQQLLSDANFVGLRLNEILPPDVSTQLKEASAKTFVDGTVRVVEFDLLREGKCYYVEARLAKINDDQLLYVVRDNSEKLMLELQNKNQQAKLFEAAKLANLGEVAGGIAHEINNPLAVISAHCTILSRTAKQVTANEAEVLLASIDKISQTTKRIAKIISSLRMVARESSDEDLALVKADDLFKDVLNFCGEKMRYKRIGLSVELESDDMIICARPIQLTQALLGLVLNSIQAIVDRAGKEAEPDADKEIGWIKLTCHHLGQQRTRIQVMDSGPGVPQHFLQKIFQPFFTTKDVGEGTGLGLATARGIIESHGGRMFYDEEAANTCFVIELPKKS